MTHALVLVEIAVSLVSLRGKMSKRQQSLLNLFKYAGQSDPKQAKIVSAEQEFGDITFCTHAVHVLK